MLRKRLKFVLPPLIVIGALLLAKVLISSRPELASQPRVDEQPLVQVHTIKRQGAAMTLGSHGTVRAKTTLQLTSDVAGRITWVNPALEVGAIIAADTPIARVDRSQYKLAEAQALLALRDAEAHLGKRDHVPAPAPVDQRQVPDLGRERLSHNGCLRRTSRQSPRWCAR